MHHTRVGVTLIVYKQDQIFFALRSSTHAQGTWGFPGGKLEYGESFVDAIIRETAEEFDIITTTPEYFHTTNDIFLDSGKHYVTIFMKAQYIAGTGKSKEPAKLSDGHWFPRDRLPQPLMLPIVNLLKERQL